MFSEEDIKNLYSSKVKLHEKYFKKYENFPPCPVKLYNYKWDYYDFPRNCCILDFIEWTKKHKINNVEHIGYTSETDPELEFITCEKKNIYYIS